MVAPATSPKTTTAFGNAEEETAIEASRAPLLEHLVELRNRVVLAIATWIAACVACYIYAGEIYGFLVQPLAEAAGAEGRRMIYTGLAEAFVTYLKVAMFGGLIVAFPIIATQFYLFLAPGLYKRERRALLPFLIAGPVLFMAGAALCYYFIFPMAWKFFLGFEHTGVAEGMPLVLEARVSEYLSLSMQLIFAFGLAFQLPIALMLLARVGLVTAAGLAKTRRYAIVAIFIAAAVLTPPDVLSQIGLALPLMLLYEAAIIGSRWCEKKAAT